MSISEQIEESLKELYGVVESFVNNEVLGLDGEAKKRNLAAMGMVVDGAQLMADGLEQMDRIILQGLAESFMNALMSNLTHEPEDFEAFMSALTQKHGPSWTLGEKEPVSPEPEMKPEPRGED